MVHKQINSYKHFLYLGPGAEDQYAAQMQLFLSDNTNAKIYFLAEGKTIPSNVKIGSSYRVYSPISRFANFIDTLRNEKPCYFHFNDNTKTANVGTHIEPVGEGED